MTFSEYHGVLNYPQGLTHTWKAWKPWKHEQYWDFWLVEEASDPSKLTFTHIRSRQAIQEETQAAWQTVLEGIGIEVRESTTISIEKAQ